MTRRRFLAVGLHELWFRLQVRAGERERGEREREKREKRERERGERKRREKERRKKIGERDREKERDRKRESVCVYTHTDRHICSYVRPYTKKRATQARERCMHTNKKANMPAHTSTYNNQRVSCTLYAYKQKNEHACAHINIQRPESVMDPDMDPRVLPPALSPPEAPTYINVKVALIKGK